MYSANFALQVTIGHMEPKNVLQGDDSLHLENVCHLTVALSTKRTSQQHFGVEPASDFGLLHLNRPTPPYH